MKQVKPKRNKHVYIHHCQSGNRFHAIVTVKGKAADLHPFISKKLIGHDWHEFRAFIQTAAVYDMMRMGLKDVYEYPARVGQLPEITL